jgi:hypothetical protein
LDRPSDQDIVDRRLLVLGRFPGTVCVIVDVKSPLASRSRPGVRLAAIGQSERCRLSDWLTKLRAIGDRDYKPAISSFDLLRRAVLCGCTPYYASPHNL